MRSAFLFLVPGLVLALAGSSAEASPIQEKRIQRLPAVFPDSMAGLAGQPVVPELVAKMPRSLQEQLIREASQKKLVLYQPAGAVVTTINPEVVVEVDAPDA